MASRDHKKAHKSGFKGVGEMVFFGPFHQTTLFQKVSNNFVSRHVGVELINYLILQILKEPKMIIFQL